MTFPIKPTPVLHGNEAIEFKKKMDSAKRGTAKPKLENLQEVLEGAVNILRFL